MGLALCGEKSKLALDGESDRRVLGADGGEIWIAKVEFVGDCGASSTTSRLSCFRSLGFGVGGATTPFGSEDVDASGDGAGLLRLDALNDDSALSRK